MFSRSTHEFMCTYENNKYRNLRAALSKCGAWHHLKKKGSERQEGRKEDTLKREKIKFWLYNTVELYTFSCPP